MASTKSAPTPPRMTEDRTRKFRVGDFACANLFAPPDFQGRRGHITEIGPGSAEYRVEFEDNQMPTTAYLMAWWLDPVRAPHA